jgi:hypothetical protein
MQQQRQQRGASVRGAALSAAALDSTTKPTYTTSLSAVDYNSTTIIY